LSMQATRGSDINITVTPVLTIQYRRYILSRDLQTTTRLAIFDKYKWRKDWIAPITLRQLISGRHTFRLPCELPPGKYALLFSIYHHGTITPTHNSPKITLEVK
ncbi:MAG TPA: hypothetical protein VGC95_02580, partial [Chitinophagaceae bacterium]